MFQCGCYKKNASFNSAPNSKKLHNCDSDIEANLLYNLILSSSSCNHNSKLEDSFILFISHFWHLFLYFQLQRILTISLTKCFVFIVYLNVSEHTCVSCDTMQLLCVSYSTETICSSICYNRLNLMK